MFVRIRADHVSDMKSARSRARLVGRFALSGFTAVARSGEASVVQAPPGVDLWSTSGRVLTRVQSCSPWNRLACSDESK